MRFVHSFRAASNCVLLASLPSTAFKRSSYQRDDFCRLGCKLMRQLFVVGYHVCYVDVAVELLYEDVFANLVAAFVDSQL